LGTRQPQLCTNGVNSDFGNNYSEAQSALSVSRSTTKRAKYTLQLLRDVDLLFLIDVPQEVD
jgi:hypothetical protein